MPARPFPANQFTVSGLAIHLMAEAEFCPITGELLGPTRLRRRHLLQMESQYLEEPPVAVDVSEPIVWLYIYIINMVYIYIIV